MCDTQLIRQNGHTFFAKNSDRESSEAQVITRHEKVDSGLDKTLNATYITIPQVPHRHGVILSQPFWMWGAEIGTNDKGVVIGNEAVFTRLVEKRGQSLLGMDLLRLGLERGATAREALDTITMLLEEYGQGGPAGFRDKSMRYDNSFIIADAHEAWVLETAGRCWVAKKVGDYAAISNQLTIGSDYDLSSPGLEDFARKQGYFNGQGSFDFSKAFSTRFMAYMGRAKERKSLNIQSLERLDISNGASLVDMISNLRSHHSKGACSLNRLNKDFDFSKSSNRDVCMHGAGLLRPSQTCASMAVELSKEQSSKIMVTGTSAPCLSLFRPVDFKSILPKSNEPSKTSDDSKKNTLWHQFEWVHRRALKDLPFRQELIHSRDELEQKLFGVYTSSLTMNEADLLAKKWHQNWFNTSRERAPKYTPLKPYDRYWKKLNRLDGIEWG